MYNFHFTVYSIRNRDAQVERKIVLSFGDAWLYQGTSLKIDASREGFSKWRKVLEEIVPVLVPQKFVQGASIASSTAEKCRKGHNLCWRLWCN